MANKVSLCMIVKNEEATIKRTLDSVENFVDEYIIGVDSYSTDNNYNIIRRWLKKRKKKKNLYFFDWKNDFSRHRNEGIKKATGDWIFILDGHEYIRDADKRKLNLIFDKILSYVEFIYLLMLNKETATMISQVRLFKKSSGAYYRNKVHNLLVGHTPEKSTLIQDILLIHDRKKEDIPVRAKQREDMITTDMEKLLEKNPNDVRSLFYLSRQYLLLHKYEKSIEYGLRYVKLINDNLCKAVALANVAVCYLSLDKLELAKKYIKEAIDADASYPYSYILEAFISLKNNDLDEAERMCNVAMQYNKIPMTFLPIPVAFYSWFPIFLCAEIKTRKGEYEDALKLLNKARSYNTFFVKNEHLQMNELEKRIRGLMEDKNKPKHRIHFDDIKVNIWCANMV